MWYDINDRPVPEYIRILGRPIRENPGLIPGTRNAFIKEWKEIEAFEDAGEIYIDVATRRALIYNREKSLRKDYHAKDRQFDFG